MKKPLLLYMVLLASACSAIAQKTDTARLIVHYRFTHIRDTTDREHPYTENMALYVGKSASAYWTYDGILADEQFKKAWAIASANSPDGNIRINRAGGTASSTQYYQYPNEQKLFTKENMFGNNYLVESTMPSIDWKISNDTATIGGLHCQKATAHFSGRDYIAWFCSDLPVRTGPWKLNGLPGVIIEAHDAKNEVVFKFDGVEKTTFSQTQSVSNAGATEKDLPPILRGLNYNPNLIAPPSAAIRTTPKEFDKLKEAVKRNPQAFGQAVVAANRAEGIKMDNMVAAPGRGPVFNNPIELPENK